MALAESWPVNTYEWANSIVFLKTKEEWGGLSNMAGGFPLEVNRSRILTSEALYQACRFPDLPEVQQEIIIQKSPMAAKMKSKPHRDKTREDWEERMVDIMRWCLQVKLRQNWQTFSKLLLDTKKMPIVEQSRRDAFWGAKPLDENILEGRNVLGCLLMDLRDFVSSREQGPLKTLEPLAIDNFQLYGKPIGPIGDRSDNPTGQLEFSLGFEGGDPLNE